ncbi:MAG: hypothetical protein NTY90_05325 [Candidatus Micrarchaeota archaeon]|nr:hypothetical protein [Candidatus Micrarchaeota archaeon]
MEKGYLGYAAFAVAAILVIVLVLFSVRQVQQFTCPDGTMVEEPGKCFPGAQTPKPTAEYNPTATTATPTAAACPSPRSPRPSPKPAAIPSSYTPTPLPGPVRQETFFFAVGEGAGSSLGVGLRVLSVSGIGYTTSYLPYASFEVTDPVTGAVTTKTIQSGGNDSVAGVYVYVYKVFPGMNRVNYADVCMKTAYATPTPAPPVVSGCNSAMQIGDEIVAANGAKVKLKSISGIGYNTTYPPSATIRIMNSRTAESVERTIPEGGSEIVYSVRITVNKITPGANQANYVNVTVAEP